MVGAPPIATRAGRAGARGGHALPQRLRRGVVGPAPHHDDGEPDRPHGQPEHLGHRRRTTGPRCSSSACAARPATRSTTPPATGCPTTPCAPSSSRSTWSAASATPGPPRPAPGATRFHDIRRVVSNLGVFDFETPERTMRLRSHHPGVTRRRHRGRHRLRAAPSPTTWPRPACPRPRSSSSSASCSTRARCATARCGPEREARRPIRTAPTRTRRCTPSCASGSACATRSCRPAWAGWPARAWWPPPARRAGSASWPRPP